MAGTVAGSLPGQTSAGGADAFVRAYDQGGLELWTAQFGTAGSDQVEGIAADDSGLYVAGFTRATPLPVSAEAFVRKFDRDGVPVWEHRYGAGSALNAARSVSVDSTGVYIADFVAQSASVRKLTHDGVEVWSRQLQNSQSEALWANAVSAGPSGLFAAGSIASTTRSAGSFVAKLAHATFVPIDIRPGDDANIVVLRSKGHVPVAILSTATFDAASVDPGAVTLAGAAVLRRPNGSFMATAEDIDGDGFDDLLLHFAAQELQLSETDTEAHLTGVTFEGEQIGGTDAVTIIP